MKTSLVLDDALFEEARKAAEKSRRSISSIISEWANLGRNLERQRQKTKPSLKTVDLGTPLISVDSRTAVMDALDDDRP